MKVSDKSINQRVRVTAVNGSMASRGEEGFISEVRGYDYRFGKIVGRRIMVWIDKTASGQPTRRVVSMSSNEVEAA